MLNQLFDRFYPNKFRCRIGLSGLDSCGKTTIIHKLKYGDIVQTIPTIGLVFTSANLNIPTSEGTLRCTVRETGAPGCSPRSLRSMIKSVLVPSAAIVWLVDGCDYDRLLESVEELQEVLATEGSNTLSLTAPILILATKQDLPNPIPLDRMREKFNTAISGRKAGIFGVSLVQDGGSNNLLAAFDWLQAALKSVPPPEPTSSSHVSSNIAANFGESLEAKLSSWISRAQTDSSPEEFLSQFQSINLPSWDHYTHIRLAYVILTTFGRQKGKDMIFDGIEKYIQQSFQTRGRTFHVTMTYFWIQLVHFGIRSMLSTSSQDADVPGNQTKEKSSIEESQCPTVSSFVDASVESSQLIDSTSSSSTLFVSPLTEFARFLLFNPFVTQANLWEDYYSREVIMTPEAKQRMIFPDKKPLPNLVIHNET